MATINKTSMLIQVDPDEFRRLLAEAVRRVVQQELILHNCSTTGSEAKPNRIMSTKMCCEFLNISPSLLQLWEKRGYIPYYKLGGKKLYNEAKIIEALERLDERNPEPVVDKNLKSIDRRIRRGARAMLSAALREKAAVGDN